MKKTILIGFLISATAIIFGQPLQTFPLSDVRLLASPFKDAEQVDLKYMLQLNPDRLLAPFLADAGLEPKAERYTNWESSGLDGHTCGHYLTALALMVASTGDTVVEHRLNYMINELARCQQKNGNGYVGGIPGGKSMWDDVAQGKLKADNFSVNKKWVPWYNLHKLFAGLRDAYLYAGNKQALDVFLNLSNWCVTLTSSLSDKQMESMMRAEHGGMNELLADAYALTGDKKYLEQAKRFSHKAILDPLLKHEDKLNGLHANTQIPKVIGFERIAELTGDTAWASAAAFFWQTVVNNRSVAIGGNSVREHFHPTTDFSSMVDSREGPESCNTYNMLKLSKALYAASGSEKYIDYYERALYNHILSSQHPDEGGFVYFTPMRPQHYRVYSQPQLGFWCCVGSGMENHGKYGELIYAHRQNDLFVNLFIPSTLTWKEKGLELTQQNRFPDEESTLLTLKMTKSAKFTLYLRYPAWVKATGLKISVNGKEILAEASPASYAAITRKWKNGDQIRVELPMENTAEYLPDHSPWVSFLHGPIVLAAKTDTTELVGLKADDSRMGHIANGPLHSEAPMLVSDSKDLAAALRPVAGQSLTFTMPDLLYPASAKNLTLIPFFRLHDARYMIYWQVTTPHELEKKQQEIRAREQVEMALEVRTIDRVSPGEQQPESDHGFQADNTETGVYKDRHWRHAAGWFSYNLKDPKGEAAVLQLTYYGLDKNRTFDIYINGVLLATQELKGDQGDKFFTVDYSLSEEILKTSSKTLTMKFVAKPGSIAGGIYFVRLLKK
jgi:DUF1680 family protein